MKKDVPHCLLLVHAPAEKTARLVILVIRMFLYRGQYTLVTPCWAFPSQLKVTFLQRE